MKHLLLFENYHSGKEVSIRPAKASEMKAFGEDVPTGDMASQNIADMVADSGDGHGAYIDGKMVGAITFRDHARIPDATEVVIMLVHPDKQGEGIGKLMLQYVEDNTKTKMLVTNPYTTEAEERFGKLGFVIDENIDPSDPNTMVRKQ